MTGADMSDWRQTNPNNRYYPNNPISIKMTLITVTTLKTLRNRITLITITTLITKETLITINKPHTS